MGPSDRNVLEVQGLTVRFDTSERSVVAVKDLGFHVRAGEVLAIVGESGSGKSVTSLSVMRLIEHGGGTIASGKISFTRRNGGKLDLAKAADSVMRTIRGGEISMIFQEPMTSLNPVFSVGTQVAEAVMLHQGLSHAEAEAEALRMLELVRIPEAKQILKRYPHQLSGGMRQRVMIAMALACNPKLIIADEPTTALDVTIQAQILELLKEIKSKVEGSIMLITHDLGVIASMADYVVVMYAGRVIEKGTVWDIFDHPLHPYTVGLQKSKPVVNKDVEWLYNIPGNVPNPINMPTYCYFRDRCQRCTAKCKGDYPPLVQVSETHSVACHLYTQGEKEDV